MNRRRILTGLVAAPFVARLGLLMPVRPVLASGGIVEVKWWELQFHQAPREADMMSSLAQLSKRASELDWWGPTDTWPGVHPKVLVQR